MRKLRFWGDPSTSRNLMIFSRNAEDSNLPYMKPLSRKEKEQLYKRKMTELQRRWQNPVDASDFDDLPEWTDEQLDKGIEQTVGQLRYQNVWRYWRYAWTVIVNIIVLFVVLSIFQVAQSSFERVVFALLVMIYISICNFLATGGKSTLESNAGLWRQLLKIEQKVVTKDDHMELREINNAQTYLDSTEANLRPVFIRYWINSSFNLIFVILALYNLAISLH